MAFLQTRRSFLGTAGITAAGLAGMSGSVQADPPPETDTIRITKQPAICIAPQYVADDLLRAEGFSKIEYVPTGYAAAWSDAFARGDVDFAIQFSASLVMSIDAGEALTMVAGVHPGCFELFGNETIRSITDLKGKKVGVQGIGSSSHVFLSVMAAYVGLDPATDIDWVGEAEIMPLDLFAEGKIDAFLAFPPEAQEARARKVPGHVVVNSALDHPWSQYFCCLLVGRRAFVEANPVATKRVLRAILKAADLCVSDPEAVARKLVTGGFTERYDYALQALSEVPYRKWRDYEPEDTIRFYALRLHEIGMIKMSPEEIIAGGTDWRFLDQLRTEFKG